MMLDVLAQHNLQPHCLAYWHYTGREYELICLYTSLPGNLQWISQLMGRVQIGISNMSDHLVSEELFEELKRCLYHHTEFKY